MTAKTFFRLFRPSGRCAQRYSPFSIYKINLILKMGLRLIEVGQLDLIVLKQPGYFFARGGGGCL
jgi:hypothetical protein